MPQNRQHQLCLGLTPIKSNRPFPEGTHCNSMQHKYSIITYRALIHPEPLTKSDNLHASSWLQPSPGLPRNLSGSMRFPGLWELGMLTTGLNKRQMDFNSAKITQPGWGCEFFCSCAGRKQSPHQAPFSSLRESDPFSVHTSAQGGPLKGFALFPPWTWEEKRKISQAGAEL